MHALNSGCVRYEKIGILLNNISNKMDYRQKMVVSTAQKYSHEDDDDEDLEELRLAALKSLRAKPANIKPPHSSYSPTGHPAVPLYDNNQRVAERREYFYQPRPQRNVYNTFRNNQNLIEIVPVVANLDTPQEPKRILSTDPLSINDTTEESKFRRYEDNVSGSDDEEVKDLKFDSGEIFPKKNETIKDAQKAEETGTDKENQSEPEDSPPRYDEEPDVAEDFEDEREEEEEEEEEEDEEEEEKSADDDDDVLLMADLEEEDSLERLMDEMEREMNVDKPVEKKEKKLTKKEAKELKKSSELSKKSRSTKNRVYEKMENSSSGSLKNDRQSVSPYSSSKILKKHRSLSPKQKMRKKSPRRSPSRQLKKSQRETLRPRSPRKSPPKFSTRLTTRRSPNRSPIRRSPPRGQTSFLRSPMRIQKSRSPQNVVYPRRARSPSRNSPGRLTPKSRSPLPRSPKVSPIRRSLPRSRSPRSPRRLSPRPRSPRLSRASPNGSPWGSPRNSPRLSSPRRRRSPAKETSRKRRSITPTQNDILSNKRETTPLRKTLDLSSEISRPKVSVMNDSVLEARRRKFESTKLIDPNYENKKIKLSKRSSSRGEFRQSPEKHSPKRIREEEEEQEIEEEREEDEGEIEDFDIPDTELSLHVNYDFDEFEDVTSDQQMSETFSEEIVTPPKIEKEKVKKKKKKDKELYQIGKLKGDMTLSERNVDEKKCKKKKKESVIIEVVKEEKPVEEHMDEEADLRTELSRRRAERRNRAAPIQSARLLQSAFKGVVTEAAKNNAKVNQRQFVKGDDKLSQKEIRRVTVVHRSIAEMQNSEDETIDSKVPVRFRLGLNKPAQEIRESKSSRKSSKRQGRKVKHKNNLSVSDNE